jgi:hypothetical protein
MTTTTAQNVQAWLAKEATPLSPFIVQLAGNRLYFGSLAPSQRMPIINTTGTALPRAREAYPRLEQEP